MLKDTLVLVYSIQVVSLAFFFSLFFFGNMAYWTHFFYFLFYFFYLHMSCHPKRIKYYHNKLPQYIFSQLLMMKCKSLVFVSASRWSWVLVCVPANMERWLLEGGHRYGVYHNIFDAKVSIRKPFKKNIRITMSDFRCVYIPSVHACEGFIYVSTNPSRCGY